MFLFLCHPPITRPAACGRSRRTSSSSGSSARRAGLEEARLVNLARQSQDSHMPCCWRGGARFVCDPTASALTQLFFCSAVHGKTAAAVSPGSTWRTESARFVIRISHLDYRPLCFSGCSLSDTGSEKIDRTVTKSLLSVQRNASMVDLCSFVLCVCCFFLVCSGDSSTHGSSCSL